MSKTVIINEKRDFLLLLASKLDNKAGGKSLNLRDDEDLRSLIIERIDELLEMEVTACKKD